MMGVTEFSRVEDLFCGPEYEVRLLLIGERPALTAEWLRWRRIRGEAIGEGGFAGDRSAAALWRRALEDEEETFDDEEENCGCVTLRLS